MHRSDQFVETVSQDDLRSLRNELTWPEWEALRRLTKLETKPILKRRLFNLWIALVAIYMVAIAIFLPPAIVTFMIGGVLGALGLFLLIVPFNKL